jgi:uncharacterized protein (TIGR03437 family)
MRTLSFIPAFLIFLSVSRGQVITTVAGTDTIPVVDGTPALQGSIEPWGVAMDAAGNLYIADGSRDVVVRVDPAGRFARFAGNGIPVYAGDGGQAKDASLNDPERVVVDGQGNVYFSESGNHRVRKVAPDGTITTYAGNGVSGFTGDNGPATSASLNYPVGLALDAQGNLYIADYQNHRIRRVSPQGTITTIAGNGTAGFSGDGGPATQAAINASGVGASTTGEIYIADLWNNRIRRVSQQGVITTVAGNGTAGFSGDGGPATAAALNQPYDVQVDAQGVLYISDYNNVRIRRVSNGTISTYVGNGFTGSGGDGSPAAEAPHNYAFAVSIAPSGALLIGDTSGHRVKSVTNGILKFIAGNGRQITSPDGAPAIVALLNGPHGVRLERSGELLIADTYNHQIRRIRANGTLVNVAGTGEPNFSGDGGPATAATLQNPEDVAVDAAGNIYIADTGTNRIRRVNPQGVISTVAGGSWDCSPAANNPVQPRGLAFHPNGDLYFADLCHYIRKINPQGQMQVVAGTGQAGFADGPAATARFNSPAKIAFDTAGNLYVADEGNHRVRKIDTSGNVTTIAGTGTSGFTGNGGPATAARLNTPRAVAVTANGSILVSEFGNHRVRIITGGVISNFAGNGVEAWAGDGGPAVQASVRRPEGIAIDSAGNVFFADWGNNRVREVLAAAPAVQTTFGTDPQISFQLKTGEVSSFRDVDIKSAILGVRYSASANQPWLEFQPDQGATPAKLRVRANAARLDAGTYRGSVFVRSPNGTPAEKEVPVVLEVSAGQPPKLVAATRSVAFSFVEGDLADSRAVTVGNSGAGTVNFSASISQGTFLSLNSNTGSATQAQPANLQVTANPAGLSVGTYTGAIHIESTGTGDKIDVPVAMTITPSQTKLTLSPAGLFFRAVAGGGTPLPQEITIANTGQGRMNWAASATILSNRANWVSVSTSSGTVVNPATDVSVVQVSVNPAGLPAGDYYGRVDVTSAGNTKQTVSVLLSVLPAGTSLPPEVRPTGLVFTAAQNSNPAAQSVAIAATGNQSVSFNSLRTTGDGANWFAHLPVGGDVSPNNPVRITVQPDFKGLAPGTYNGLINFQFGDGTSQTVSVLSIVTDAGAPQSDATGKEISRAAGGCTPSKLNMVLETSQSVNVKFGQPSNLGVRVVDSCGEAVTNANKNAAVKVSYSPTVEPAQSMDYTPTGRWNKTFQARNVRNGPVRASITAFVSLPNGTILADQVDVQLNVSDTAAAPVISPGAVLNGASFAADVPLAPGTIVTLLGTGLADSDQSALGMAPAPTDFNGVQVRLGDRALPLFYVGRDQINAQVPYDLPLNTQQQILVRKGETLSVPDRFTVGPAQPAVFTRDQNGLGQGVIVNGITNVLADGAHPVKPGDVVTVYCTGLGLVSPSVGEGALAPQSPLSWTVGTLRVSIGGRDANVQFSGLAPGFVGLYQVNAFVPAGVSGNDVPVVLEIGGQRSAPVTIAVQ